MCKYIAYSLYNFPCAPLASTCVPVNWINPDEIKKQKYVILAIYLYIRGGGGKVLLQIQI